MKTIAVMFNLGFFMWIFYLAIDEGITGGSDFLLLIFILLLPIINIFTIFMFSKNNEKDSWFGLFLKRKTLEEKKKIQELEEK